MLKHRPSYSLPAPDVECRNPTLDDLLRSYRSDVKEVDSAALSRLLKRHFNNFILECHFAASENREAFLLFRSRQCNAFMLEKMWSGGHDLTERRLEAIASAFYHHCLTTTNAIGWKMFNLAYHVEMQSDMLLLHLKGTLEFPFRDYGILKAPYSIRVLIHPAAES